jgi:seryl-tRNA synthetase
MTLTELFKAVMDIGITPVLLLTFIKYFFDRDKSNDSMWGKRYDEIYNGIKERETKLVAECASREDLIHAESNKREKLMRLAAEKRENTLLATIDGFRQAIETISNSMNELKSDICDIQEKIENIEKELAGQGTSPVYFANVK